LLRSIKIIVFFISIFTCAQLNASTASTVLFFDLGNTLINTKNEKQFKFFDSTLSYLNSLKEKNYRMGLLINIPESWGESQEQKLKSLKDYVNNRWKESKPFPWSYFEVIFLSPDTKRRKPNPYLFNQAMNWAKNKTILYQSENREEVFQASSMGIASFQVNQRKDQFYIPLNKINSYLNQFYKPQNQPKLPLN